MLIAIGDIHGEVGKLHRLLQRLLELPLAEEDRLIFLGDYVDRGPDIRTTLDTLIKIREMRPNSVFLRGNHDQTMLDARDVCDPHRETDLELEDVGWWITHGGQSTMRQYGGGARWYERVPASHWRFLESTALEYAVDGYIFVHAGLLPPGMHWFDREDPRLWIREPFLESTADFGGVVVYGHTPTDDGRPRVEANKIGIDTGAVYGGPLTAALLTPGSPESVRFLQA